MQIDVLVVGQGLAGSLLAWELCRRQLRVVVVDNGLQNASQVAAGLINPVTGQRLVKPSDLETLLPVALDVYRTLAACFRRNFFVPMPMLRILRSQREQEMAERRLAQAAYRDYLLACKTAPDDVQAPFGMLWQKQTGYLQTEALLAELRAELIAGGCYRRETVDFDAIRLEPDLAWRDIRPSHIVFCEGHRARVNPWFGGLPFQLVKGEILAGETVDVLPARILNYGHWLIPLDAQRFKTGATFDTQLIDENPTPPARQTLLASVQTVCPRWRYASIDQHRAGIRPATLDKQPFVGSHPRYPRLHIFNGFGAKGSLAIPWYAARFADYLQTRGELPPSADIRRYHATHFAD